MRSTFRVADWIRRAATATPRRACFVTPERDFTFAEVNSRVNRVAHALHARGVRQGDRVAIFATDSHQYVETILACMKLGAWYTLLNFKLTATEVRALLSVAEPTALFFDARYDGLIEQVDVASVRLRISYGPSAIADLEFEQICATGEDVEIDTSVADTDIVSLGFSSGTTGLPKGVMYSQRLVKWFVTQAIIERRVTSSSFHYSAAPMFHVAGLSFTLMGVAGGFPILVLPAFDPATVAAWLGSGRVDGCFMVPTMIDSVLQVPSIADGNYSALRSIGYGAAPMPPSLLRRAMSTFGCDFMNLFGAGTEAGLQTVLTPEDHRRALAGEEHLLSSIGRAAYMVEIRLCDDDMKDVPVGAVGEIVSRADAVMSGYLGEPELTESVFADGWFRGGDLATMDEEGFLYLRGRRKDLIIRGGENIYPQDIETILTDHPAVAEVAVIGVPDEHWGERVRAHVVAVPGTALDVDGLRAFCRERLAAFKVPAEFVVEPALPRNASGKVLKRELRQRG